MPLRRIAKKLTDTTRKLAHKGPPYEGRPAGEVVIITGMSGSGKASVLKAFEDLGYYCVDNLPVGLIPRFAELVGQSSEIERTALVVDVREGRQLEELPQIVKSVRRMISTKVIFLEASDSILLASLQRDTASAPSRGQYSGEGLAHRRAASSAANSISLRSCYRHFEIQRPRTARAHHRTFSNRKKRAATFLFPA